MIFIPIAIACYKLYERRRNYNKSSNVEQTLLSEEPADDDGSSDDTIAEVSSPERQAISTTGILVLSYVRKKSPQQNDCSRILAICDLRASFISSFLGACCPLSGDLSIVDELEPSETQTFLQYK